MHTKPYNVGFTGLLSDLDLCLVDFYHSVTGSECPCPIFLSPGLLPAPIFAILALRTELFGNFLYSCRRKNRKKCASHLASQRGVFCCESVVAQRLKDFELDAESPPDKKPERCE